MLASVRLMALALMAFVSAVCAEAGGEAVGKAAASSRDCARIDFKVNLTDFDKTYHGNGPGMDKALARIDSMLLDPRMRVERITVVGTASPEGPYGDNVRLAAGRARALVEVLQARYSFPDSIYRISTVAEDWEGMRGMLAGDSSIPYAEVVIGFIDETGELDPDVRERRLKQLDGGRPYSSMRDNVLPWLRRASVVVDYYARSLRLQGQAACSVPAVPAFTVPQASVQAPDIARIAFLQDVPAALPRHRFLAVKTNLLWDAALCANLGFEVELWPHWSLDVPVWYSPYDITDRWRIRLLAVQPEVRWWPGDAGAGHYFGVHATVAGFNVSTGGDYRYQDPNHAAFGLGVGYGYAFHLDKARRWSLEAQVGAGYISYKWIKYNNTGRSGAEVSRSGGTYWGITRAGLTISYKFYRERKGKGVLRW